MRKWFLSVTFIFSVLFSADVNLSIDNFTDDGAGNVTFDIMMTNTEAVGGFQFDFLSGNGMYDSGDDCRCDQGDDGLPDGCNECYYDYGVDKVRNNKEADTSTSGYSYGCEDSGLCTDGTSSSSDCEDEGVCSDDSFTSLSDCSDDGSCSNADYTTECECAWYGHVWTSAGNIWIPEYSYMMFDDIEDCFENLNDDGDQLRWDYYNPDGNNDNYATVSEVEGFDQQRCHVREYDSEYHEEETVAGQCSQFGSVCIATGGTQTGAGTDYPIGTVLDWPLSCCNVTQGGQAFNPFRDKDLCEGTVSINNNDYVVDSDWTWTSYEDEATCESSGGFWYGSEDGTEGNEAYDVGEYFIDGDASLSVTAATGGALIENNFMVSASGSLVIGFSLMGTSIPTSESEVLLGNFTSTYSALNNGEVYELLSMSVCGTGSLGDWSGINCPIDLIFSDSSGDPLTVDFAPSIWTVGTGISSIADDGICSSIGGWGEDSEDDSTCGAYCGDGYCNNGEAFSTCSVDCVSSCGDDVCSLFEGNDNGEVETPDTCPGDCTVFGCGDFICSEGETNESCPYDCYNANCGDGSCDTSDGETALNCYIDCQPICGNSVCDAGENIINCSSDCESECGDGIYHHPGFEGNPGTEGPDCVDYQITCGDDVYHYLGEEFNGLIATTTGQCTGTDSWDCQAETFDNCPSDYDETCGDGFYHHSGLDDPGSENESCLADYVITSGDGYCDATTEEYDENDSENPDSEEACPSICGDGFYDWNQSLGGSEDETCTDDYEVTQGDGYCDEANEEVIGEDIDCPLPICGEDGCQSPYETFLNCDSDCDSFCGDGLYDHSGVDLDGDGVFGNEDNTCIADYAPECGDGIYDWESGEVSDGNDEGSEPDCDYTQTCGDGYYDYVENEVISCYTANGEGVDFSDYITNCSTYDFCDYVLTDGDGFCDPINEENLQFLISTDELDCGSCPNDDVAVCPLECSNENYSEADCIIPGCTDSTACNFSSSATSDDESCVYIDEDECDCDGNVELGCGCGEPAAEEGKDCDGNILAIVDIPIVFSLSENYPNPFNPVTLIEYSVERAGHVNISIYNIMGHKVFNLVSGYHSPGIRYSAVWNSNTQSNIPVSTGIYFYEMRAGDYIERKKMVLVK